MPSNGTHDPAFSVLNDKLVAKLKARGADGIRGLARSFKVVDENENKRLDRKEFGMALRFVQANFKPAEIDVLFSRYDRDGSGEVDFDEFLRGVRGTLNTRRRALS